MNPDSIDVFDGLPFRLHGPVFQLEADGRRFASNTMTAHDAGVWREGDVEVRVSMSKSPDGSRSLTLEAEGVAHVSEVCLADGIVEPRARQLHNHVWFDAWGLQRSTVVFARGGDEGLFMCYANPFAVADLDGDRVRLSYRPAMDVDGTFRSDALVVGATTIEQRPVRREVLRGRDVVAGETAGYVSTLGPPDSTSLDAGEIGAVRAAVAARVPWSPERSRSAHWDWGENLFRLDAADPEAGASYDRLASLCRELGIEVLLLAPGTARSAQPDAGGNVVGHGPWQDVMWLGKGLDVGGGRWDPTTADAGPAGSLLDVTRREGLEAVAYTNPQYLWLRDDRWRVKPDPDPLEKDPHAYVLACLAVPDARRWLADTLLQFADTYGLSGFSFDFIFWFDCHATDHGHEPGPGSRYAQWDGFRRVVSQLREEHPDAWLEGLTGIPQLLPWGSAALTHPHPDIGDNQPQWLPAWPDLSLDRAAGNYQRRTAFWMRNFAFTPSYKVPGQVGHQANRQRMVTPERGWDWEGARYNLLSAIASGPSSLSVCFLPCWDEDEWEGVRDRDGEFFRRWIAFARDHEAVLARLQDLFDEPRPGAVDGTIARADDGSGFAFLTNPDYREHVVTVPVTDGFVLRELHPEPGRLWDNDVTVEPHTVTVLELLESSEVELPAVFGLVASVSVDEPLGEAAGMPGTEVPVGQNLAPAGRMAAGIALGDARGVPGSLAVAAVRLPGGELRELTVRFASDGITPTLGPWRDGAGGDVELTELEGNARLVTSWTPGPALPAALASLAPPTAPRGEEVHNPWSDPSRLRLFPVLADPKSARVRMWVDGDEAEMQAAYVGTYEDVTSPITGHNNLLGWYADLTDRLQSADDLTSPWAIELEVDLAWRGQLTGVHVAHLPRRTTGEFEIVT